MEAESTFSYWPELLTDASGRLTNKRRVFKCVENEYTDIPKDNFLVNGKVNMYPSVREKDYVFIRERKSSLKIQAGRYIGLIPLNENVMLDVGPRVPLENLTRIMRIAEGQPQALDAFLRYYCQRQEPLPSMIDYFAGALIDRVNDIAIDGLHREYVTKSEGTSFPRGKIHIGETLRRYSTQGVNHNVAASWYEPTVDTPTNRCLKYSLWFLASHYNSTNKKHRYEILRRIERSYRIFSGVELDRSTNFLDSSTVRDPETLPSIRAYYKPALYLALLILQNRGISFSDRKRGVLMSSLLINLQETFEKYLRNVLREKLRQRVQVLDGKSKSGQKRLFDEPFGRKDESAVATPDIVFKDRTPRTDGSYFTPLVAEVKYKDFVEPSGDDRYQAIAYSACYRVPVIIIHPRVKKKTHGMYPCGRNDFYTLYHYVFDLAAKDPEAEEEMLAASFRQLLAAHLPDSGN